MLQILSLGAGVQSTTLFLMSCYSYFEITRVDAAIFADTGGEPEYVYEHLEKLEEEGRKYGIPVYRVRAPGPTLAEHVLARAAEGKPGGIPYYLEGEGRGRGSRSCTRDFKIRPIHRKVRELLGAKPPDFKRVSGVGAGNVAELWIGFSEDEIMRVKNNYPVKYIKPRYPLIELGYERRHCEAWMAKRGWTAVYKSACVFCPYHADPEWRRIKDRGGADWEEAVRVDAGLDGAFLHSHKKPLPLVEFSKGRRSSGSCSPFGCRSGAF